MKLIFIYGLPATGKLTVGSELALLTGYRLFHSHLTVDLLLAVFDFGVPSFVDLREQIWLSVFAHACRSGVPGLIFTFAPEPSVRPGFIPEVLRVVRVAAGEVDFVELVCPVEELKTRINNPSRLAYKKLASASLFEQLYRNGPREATQMPTPAVSIDTSLFTPVEAARAIVQTLNLKGIKA